MSSAADVSEIDGIVGDLCSKVADLSEGKLSRDAVDPAQSILDHGYVDSLTAVLLLAYIEERWGVTIEDTELLDELETLEAIARRVHAER